VSLIGAHVSDGPNGDAGPVKCTATVRVASSEVISIIASRNSGETDVIFLRRATIKA
jgi:hypothetical protein